MTDVNTIITLLGIIAGLALTWFIADSQGIFKRSILRISLYGLAQTKNSYPEIVIVEPFSEQAILSPLLVKVANKGTASTFNVEVSIDADRNSVVMYPKLYLTPGVTDSTEQVDGETFPLGQGLFRRFFKIPQINPDKSLQLNNFGFPQDLVNNNTSTLYSVLVITLYEHGKRSTVNKFGVWWLDTSKTTFRGVVVSLARELQDAYEKAPLYKRFLMRLQHKKYEHRMCFVEVTGLKHVPAAGQDVPLLTAEKLEESYGTRFVTGQIFAGPWGLIQ